MRDDGGGESKNVQNCVTSFMDDPLLKSNIFCKWFKAREQNIKAKSDNGDSILRSSQFLILPQLPQKIKLASKVVKFDSKIIISLPKI